MVVRPQCRVRRPAGSKDSVHHSPGGAQSFEPPPCADSRSCLLGLVHVGDELREVNGITVLHKRPDEISQILVRAARVLGVWWCFGDPSRVLPGARGALAQSPCFHGRGAGQVD